MAIPPYKLNPLVSSFSLEEPYTIESPFSKLPAEIILHIFSYLGFVDLWRASQVCQNWYQYARDLLPKVRQLCSTKMVGDRILSISPMGLGVVIYRQSANASSSHVSQSLNLESDACYDEGPYQNTMSFIGYNYYMLNKMGDTLLIDDFFSGAKLTGAEHWSHFAINKRGFTHVLENFSIPRTALYFTSIEKGPTLQTKSTQLYDCASWKPVSLLHNDWVIYTTDPGILRIRDVTIEELPQVGRDLVSPEIEKALCDGMTHDQIGGIMSRNGMFCILASGSILVTSSMQNILVWDLDTRQVIRNIPSFHAHLDALEGFTLLTHTAETITLWDLKEERITKKAEWKNHSPYCKNPVGLYKNKVYILSEKEDTGTLTVYDFSKKA